MTFETEPTPATAATCLTRRERRVEREQARPSHSGVGWLAYGISVAAVIVGAAWMASTTTGVPDHRARVTPQPASAVVSQR